MLAGVRVGGKEIYTSGLRLTLYRGGSGAAIGTETESAEVPLVYPAVPRKRGRPRKIPLPPVATPFPGYPPYAYPGLTGFSDSGMSNISPIPRKAKALKSRYLAPAPPPTLTSHAHGTRRRSVSMGVVNTDTGVGMGVGMGVEMGVGMGVGRAESGFPGLPGDMVLGLGIPQVRESESLTPEPLTPSGVAAVAFAHLGLTAQVREPIRELPDTTPSTCASAAADAGVGASVGASEDVGTAPPPRATGAGAGAGSAVDTGGADATSITTATGAGAATGSGALDDGMLGFLEDFE